MNEEKKLENAEEKKLSWKTLRHFMRGAKCKYALDGASEDVRNYVRGLEAALKKHSNDSHYRIVVLENQIKEMKANIKRCLMSLLKDCYEDQMSHTELRMIRDSQKPRLYKLSIMHPEIYKDFMRAHTEIHKILRENREKRIKAIDEIILELEDE